MFNGLDLDLYNKLNDAPMEKIRFIGLVGTKGKRATAKIILDLFKLKNLEVGHISKGKMSIGKEIFKDYKDKLGSSELLDFLEYLLERGIYLVLIEINSTDFKEECLRTIQFDTAVHTDLYIENTVQGQECIMSLSHVFKRLRERGTAIINMDDKNNMNLIEGMNNRFMITYGLCTKATITASSIDSDSDLKFLCCIQRGITTIGGLEIEPMEFPARIKGTGPNAVHNTLAALAVALIYDISPKQIMESF